MTERKQYMKSKLKRYKKIWITKEVYTHLRNKKKELIEDKRGKSMTEIADIILKDYFK